LYADTLLPHRPIMNGIDLWAAAIQLGCLYYRLYWLASALLCMYRPICSCSSTFFPSFARYFCISEVATYL